MNRILLAAALCTACGFAAAQERVVYEQTTVTPVVVDTDASAMPVYADDDDSDADDTYVTRVPVTTVEERTLAPVTVEAVDVDRLVQDCTPPSSAPECAGFHELIRENFTPNEIGLLFGAATAHADYRTNYDFAREHYANFLRDLAVNGMPAPAPVAYVDDDD